MRFTLRKLTFSFFSLSLIFIACQQDSEFDDPNYLDQDMQVAIELVDEYLKSTQGRSDSENVSITVLQYDRGKIWYQTYVDGVSVYEEVTEETVTAVASPGEYVFWYGGKGLDELDEIDFDEMSRAYLEKDPDEIYHDRLWAIMIPDDIHKKTEYLKYDIVYQYSGNTGPIIRLDPKIRIKGEGVDEGPSN